MQVACPAARRVDRVVPAGPVLRVDLVLRVGPADLDTGAILDTGEDQDMVVAPDTEGAPVMVLITKRNSAAI